MKTFVILVLLFLALFFIANTSLANVDLTPGTPAATYNSNTVSNPTAEPQVINIQNVAPVTQSASGGSVPVTGAIPTGPVTCTDPYIIRPGDMLSSIADLCNTTVAVIRQANPDITNVNMIYPGQQIRIPGAPPAQANSQQVIPQTAQVPTVAPQNSVSPQVSASPEPSSQVPVTTPAAQLPVTGAQPLIQPGTGLQVKAIHYPPNTMINIAIGPQTVGYNIVATGVTDPNGNFNTRVTVPAAPNSQTPWVVVVATTGNPPIQAMSNPFYIGSNQ